PTAFFLLVVNIVYVFFDTFGIIDAMTGGGPAGATETLVYKVFFDGRLGGNLGGSAAQSVIVLLIGLVIVAFPVYLTFVASTSTTAEVANGQMGLLPGPNFIRNYSKALFEGTSGTTRTPVAVMLLNSFLMAMIIAVGKIAISIISAFAVVYFRFP